MGRESMGLGYGAQAGDAMSVRDRYRLIADAPMGLSTSDMGAGWKLLVAKAPGDVATRVYHDTDPQQEITFWRDTYQHWLDAQP